MAAITQQACLLWTVARGKGTGYTESKIEISLMDDSSQQPASLTKRNANDFRERQQLQTAIAPPEGPSLAPATSGPWSREVPSLGGTAWAEPARTVALGQLTSRPLDPDPGSLLNPC